MNLSRRALFCAAAVGSTFDAYAGTVDRATAIAGWRRRIDSFLQRGIVPIIDTEFTFNRNIERSLDFVMAEMDKGGIAQICLAPGENAASQASLDAFRRFPDRFIPTTKDGSSPEWYAHRTDFAAITQRELAGGDYFMMGEFELRHYPSPLQFNAGRMDRDVDVPLDDPAVDRIFDRAATAGVAIQIHYEIEDRLLPPLEALLARHPRTAVIWCHLGQVRFRERNTIYGPDYVDSLISRFPNLHFDLATAGARHVHPLSKQRDATLFIFTGRDQWGGYLDLAWRRVLLAHPERFLAASDSDGDRFKSMRETLDRQRSMILAEMPAAAQRAIAFGNAWRLVTGQTWT
jgi:predicted TIM-barrel fold metal-dependent hydrolase